MPPAHDSLAGFRASLVCGGLFYPECSLRRATHPSVRRHKIAPTSNWHHPCLKSISVRKCLEIEHHEFTYGFSIAARHIIAGLGCVIRPGTAIQSTNQWDSRGN